MTENTKSSDAKSSPKSSPKSSQVDAKLLETLVCPVTKETLIYDADAQELVSKAAGLAYPIRDGIPIMLPDEARSLNDDEL